MGDEPNLERPYLEQLVGALQRLRARVDEVRPDQPAWNEAAINLELSTLLMEAQIISDRLATVLADALRPIRPNFLVEAIDDAIRIIEGQRDCQ